MPLGFLLQCLGHHGQEYNGILQGRNSNYMKIMNRNLNRNELAPSLFY